MSFSFSDAETRHSIPLRETLAIIKALMECEWMLIGNSGLSGHLCARSLATGLGALERPPWQRVNSA